jgi:hypothetical protein
VPDLGVLAGSPNDSGTSKTQGTRTRGRDTGCGQQPGSDEQMQSRQGMQIVQRYVITARVASKVDASSMEPRLASTTASSRVVGFRVRAARPKRRRDKAVHEIETEVTCDRGVENRK